MSAQEQSNRDEIARKIAAEYDAPFLTCIPFAGFPITATQQWRRRFHLSRNRYTRRGRSPLTGLHAGTSGECGSDGAGVITGLRVYRAGAKKQSPAT